MRNQAIRAIAERTAAEAATHWRLCLKHGLEHHSPEAHADVDRCVAAYFARLQMMPDPASRALILGAIEALFSDLERIRQLYGDGLLETDEREIFVTAVNRAAAIAGLDLNTFDRRDPTFGLRNF